MFLKYIKSWLDVILLIFGMASIVIGAFMIYVPAGWIMMGLCLIGFSLLLVRNDAFEARR